MTPTDVAEYFGIGLQTAYKIMKGNDFPSFRVGSQMRVTSEAFEACIKKQQYRTSSAEE